MTSNGKLGVSVVGAGNHAVNHLRVIQQLQGDIRLVSVVDTVPERARQVAETYGAVRWSTEYEEELAKEDVDAVILSLPPYLNAPYSIAACRRGVHVLCEKPMALTLQQGQEMIQSAQEHGVLLMIAHNHRFDSSSMVARKMILDGEIGELRHISGDLLTYVKQPSTEWRRSVERTGGFVLPLLGCHLVDLMLWVTDTSARRVYCEMSWRASEWEGEDEVSITMSLVDGHGNEFPATARMSANVAHRRHETIIGGTKHTLTLSRARLVKDGEVVHESDQSSMSFYRQMQEFFRAIKEDRSSISSGTDALRTLEVVDAAYRSAKAHKVVEYA